MDITLSMLTTRNFLCKEGNRSIGLKSLLKSARQEHWKETRHCILRFGKRISRSIQSSGYGNVSAFDAKGLMTGRPSPGKSSNSPRRTRSSQNSRRKTYELTFF